ncbi:MAG: helix-turn-helix transcriptional regulator [Christensenellaceae bacterium]|nr:helix-turn-helix transcriptional regulator [Christensenellaceae bacterium]
MNKDIKEKTDISSSTLAKLRHGEDVNTNVLLHICEVLNCQIGDMAK